MADMLVKLYGEEIFHYDLDSEVRIVRAMAVDKKRVIDFIKEHFENFGPGWISETEAAILKTPAKCLLAIINSEIVGFACYDSTALGFFGPFGVSESHRKKGIGDALLKKTLLLMKNDGYGYAIIGWASSLPYYAKSVGAIEIKDSHPGVYTRLSQIDKMHE